MKLSKAIIKKYGITKKAWAVARGKKSRGGKMARHRFKTHSRGRSKGFGKKDSWLSILGGAVYGVVRPKLNEMAQPLMEKMPFGDYNNEILMGGTALGIDLLVGRKNRMVHDFMLPIEIIEAASAAETATRGMMGSSGSAPTQIYY